jgi:hypothetical protein
MPISIHAGATFMMDTFGGLHLHIILNNPVVIQNFGQQPQVLLVSVTSIKPDKAPEETVLLQQDDHPFIQHPSYIAYRFADIKSASIIAKLGTPHEPISQQLLQRIIRGAFQSTKARNFFKQALKEIYPELG